MIPAMADVIGHALKMARWRACSLAPIVFSTPVSQTFLFDLEHLAEALGHGVGIRTPPTLVVADHVLANIEFLGELGLRHTCLQSGTGKQVADADCSTSWSSE